jgi:translation initiation factor 2B subunit (eIF-2B alpha/beta/delta family)
MSVLETLLSEVSEDRSSGSSEIYSRLLLGLEKALADSPSCQDWKRFSEGLSKVKRSMAPLQNVAGSLKVLLEAKIPEEQLNGFVKGFLVDLIGREERAATVIAKMVWKEHRPRKVVTLSYSGTVLAALLVMPREIEVSVAESLPLGEGAVTYRRLAEKGLKVSLFRDAMIPGEVAGADLVLVGADGVCPEGVVNKVGTLALALAAGEAGVPMVVLCSTSKLIPVLDLDPAASSRTLEGLLYRERLFEATPLHLIRSIITEEGVVSGEEMQKRLLRDRGKMNEAECHYG